MKYYSVASFFLGIQLAFAMEQSPVVVENNASGETSGTPAASLKHTLCQLARGQEIDLIALESGEYTLAQKFMDISVDSEKKSAESPQEERAQLHIRLCDASRIARGKTSRIARGKTGRLLKSDRFSADEVKESPI